MGTEGVAATPRSGVAWSVFAAAMAARGTLSASATRIKERLVMQGRLRACFLSAARERWKGASSTADDGERRRFFHRQRLFF